MYYDKELTNHLSTDLTPGSKFRRNMEMMAIKEQSRMNAEEQIDRNEYGELYGEEPVFYRKKTHSASENTSRPAAGPSAAAPNFSTPQHRPRPYASVAGTPQRSGAGPSGATGTPQPRGTSARVHFEKEDSEMMDMIREIRDSVTRLAPRMEKIEEVMVAQAAQIDSLRETVQGLLLDRDRSFEVLELMTAEMAMMKSWREDVGQGTSRGYGSVRESEWGYRSASDKASDAQGQLQKSNLVMWGWELPPGVTDPAAVKEKMIEEVASFTEVELEDMVDMKPLGKPVEVMPEDPTTVPPTPAVYKQGYLLQYRDPPTAHGVLVKRNALYKKLEEVKPRMKVFIGEDLTKREKALREKRRAVYNELKAREGWWVQWRGAEIYYNTNHTYHENKKSKDGSAAVNKRGDWFKYTDYRTEPATEQPGGSGEMASRSGQEGEQPSDSSGQGKGTSGVAMQE